MAMPKVGHLRASIRGGESRELYVCFLFELKYASTPEHENESLPDKRARIRPRGPTRAAAPAARHGGSGTARTTPPRAMRPCTAGRAFELTRDITPIPRIRHSAMLHVRLPYQPSRNPRICALSFASRSEQSGGRRPASERYPPRPHLVHSCIAEATYATFLLLRPAMEMRPSLVR